MESSWAQRQGIPSKSGHIMQHGVTIQKNEKAATKLMRNGQWLHKISSKVKTKGRFQIEISTNGQLNRLDSSWAQKANPAAHAAHVYREAIDIKMLQKKKQSRELSSMLNKKGAKILSGPKNEEKQQMLPKRGSVTSEVSLKLNQKSESNIKSVAFSK